MVPAGMAVGAAIVLVLLMLWPLRIVDAVRATAPEAVCQCELVALFHMSQPALAKHLRVLVDAGVLASQRRGTWTYYYSRPGGLEELTRWLS